MNDPQRVAVVGATGYAGFELAQAPASASGNRQADILSAREQRARPVNCLTEIFPQLRGWGEAPCRPFSVEAIAKSGASVAFLATPHEASTELVPQLLAAGLRVVDLSGAFRFRDPQTFENWYKLPAPERRCWPRRSMGCRSFTAMRWPSARLVANPGCYPTSVILGLRPLVEAGWIARERGIVCDCKSGASGAGKEPKRELQFVEVDENFRAYGLFTHRHTPEVTEHLELDPGEVMFSTHLLPLARGILSTLYVWLDERREAAKSKRSTGSSMRGSRWCGCGRREALPELQHVAQHEFLRHRVCAGWRGRTAGGGELPGQSGQGRGGPSGTKHERDDGFRGGGGSAMRMVVKIAGALLDDADAVQSLARQIAQLAQQGHELLVVHGGGKIFTATLKRMGIESRFVNGSARHRPRNARRGRDGDGRPAEQAHGRRHLRGGPAGDRAVRVRRELLSGRADDARRGDRLAGIRRLSDGRQPGIPRVAVARRDRAGGVVPGPGRRRRDSTTSMPTTWPRPARNTFTPTG